MCVGICLCAYLYRAKVIFFIKIKTLKMLSIKGLQKICIYTKIIFSESVSELFDLKLKKKILSFSDQSTSKGIEQSTESIPLPTLPIINPPPAKTTLEEDSSTQQQEQEEEEPRFTVAQLISAFNRHQEAASQGCASYSTGPLALRLFMDMNNKN